MFTILQTVVIHVQDHVKTDHVKETAIVPVLIPVVITVMDHAKGHVLNHVIIVLHKEKNKYGNV